MYDFPAPSGFRSVPASLRYCIILRQDATWEDVPGDHEVAAAQRKRTLSEYKVDASVVVDCWNAGARRRLLGWGTPAMIASGAIRRPHSLSQVPYLASAPPSFECHCGARPILLRGHRETYLPGLYTPPSRFLSLRALSLQRCT